MWNSASLRLLILKTVRWEVFVFTIFLSPFSSFMVDSIQPDSTWHPQVFAITKFKARRVEYFGKRICATLQLEAIHHMIGRSSWCYAQSAIVSILEVYSPPITIMWFLIVYSWFFPSIYHSFRFMRKCWSIPHRQVPSHLRQFIYISSSIGFLLTQTLLLAAKSALR